MLKDLLNRLVTFPYNLPKETGISASSNQNEGDVELKDLIGFDLPLEKKQETDADLIEENVRYLGRKIKIREIRSLDKCEGDYCCYVRVMINQK